MNQVLLKTNDKQIFDLGSKDIKSSKNDFNKVLANKKNRVEPKQNSLGKDKKVKSKEDIELEEDSKDEKQSNITILVENLINIISVLEIENELEEIGLSKELIPRLESLNLDEIVEDFSGSDLQKVESSFLEILGSLENINMEGNKENINNKIKELLDSMEEIGLSLENTENPLINLEDKTSLDFKEVKNPEEKPILLNNKEESSLKVEDNLENEDGFNIENLNQKSIKKQMDNVEDDNPDESEMDTGMDGIVDIFREKETNNNFKINKESVETFKDIEVDENNVIKQIAEKVEFSFLKDKSEIRVNLKPEFLGKMVMNLEIAKGEIVAKVFVENEKTKHIIEANILNLQEEIEDTGMEIKTFEVFVGSNLDYEQQNETSYNFFNKYKNDNLKKNKNLSNGIAISNNYEATTIADSKTSILLDGQTMDLQA